MALTPVMQKQKQGHKIEAIRNDSKLTLEITLDCFEFTFNCPSVQQPDFGKVLIKYTPNRKVAETKSLKFYLQTYRYYNCFNEELTTRILQDFIFYIEPKRVTVTLIQNSRGGIANTCQASYDVANKADSAAVMGYKPKRGFQGGWAMVG